MPFLAFSCIKCGSAIDEASYVKLNEEYYTHIECFLMTFDAK